MTGSVDDTMPEPEIVQQVGLNDALDSGEFDWLVPEGGGWLHAVVVDPLPDTVPADRQDVTDTLTSYPEEGGLAALLVAIAPLLDMGLLSAPEQCRPEAWEAWSLMCMPADTESFGTFYVPRELRLLMGTEFEDGQPTGYAMGAISSAFHTGRL